jgi:hypothetical protein
VFSRHLLCQVDRFIQSLPTAIDYLVTQFAALLHKDGRRTVWLSKVDKAPQMAFCEDRLTITSQKGYRMVLQDAHPA